MIHAHAEAGRNIRSAAEESSEEEYAVKQKIKELSREKLLEILSKVTDILSEEQHLELEMLVSEVAADNSEPEPYPVMVRMSQEFVDEKLAEMKVWMQQIDEGELYLDIEEYEDDSSGHWNPDWVTDYYDNQGIGEKLMSAIRFAKDCVEDRRYAEAHLIYEWLWEMEVFTDSEYGEPLALWKTAEERIISTDMKELALLTLYVDYQIQKPENRAEDLFLYFVMAPFQQLHIEEMFHVGREQLTGTEQFWKDWIALLKTKSGDVAGRLLKEAVLYSEGIDGLVKMADENAKCHPSLYLAVMREYDRNHDYARIEAIGQKAMKKLDKSLIVRSEIALKAAQASDVLGYTDEMMRFCWESFQSESTEKNYLRLFGTKEMAEKYGLRGQEVLCSRIKETPESYMRDVELRKNVIGEHTYLKLSFYMGEFKRVKEASKNPRGSLGWSSGFIPYGIRMLLLYLYEKPFPSKAAAGLAAYVGFREEDDSEAVMGFEREILEESRKCKISTFWNYFQRWKQYFPMEKKERETYLAWAEKIVYSRADAIVGGQHRNHYGESAQMLAIVGEIKESMGIIGAKREIYGEYKRKFPRHSSFQKEMNMYF